MSNTFPIVLNYVQHISNSFKLCPTHFSMGEKNFAEGASPPPGYGPVHSQRKFAYLHEQLSVPAQVTVGKCACQFSNELKKT